MQYTNTQGISALGTLYKRSKTSLCVLGALGLLSSGLSSAQEATDITEEKDGETEVIEVTGLRSSIITAQQAKMNSNKIMDGISAEDLGALPDRSVTETLQRVAGIAIDRYMSQGDPEHFSVEGNGVIVRGLSQVRSELNGRSSFSANGGRTLSFGDVPPELLNAVNIYKSPTADQIEGGLAGTIDLETKLPFHSDGQQISFNVSGSYGDKIEETTPSYSVLYSNNWDTEMGKFGFLADFAYSELSTRNDSMYVRPFFARDDINGQEGNTVYLPRGADWRSMNFNREREGSYVALQWAPSDNHELTLTYFKSNYDMMWDEDAIFVSNDITQIQASADSQYNSNGALVKGRLTSLNDINMGSDIRVAKENSQTTDVSFAYKYTHEAFNLNVELQKITAETKKLDSTVAAAVRVPYIDVDLSGSLPQITSDPEVLGDASEYNWDFLMDNQVDNSADMTAVQADVEYFLENDVFKTVKFGVRFSDSKSDNIDTGYNWGAIGNWLIDGGAVLSGASPAEESLHLNQFENFFAGDVPSPANIYAPLRRYAEGFPESYSEVLSQIEYVDWALGSTWQPRNINDEQWANNQSEKTQAAYVMVDFEFDDLKYPVMGNVGLRYVKTKNVASGQAIFTSSLFTPDGSSSPLEAENTYSNFLPSLNVKIELADDLLLRFAAAKAMARPDFSDMTARIEFSANIKDESRDSLLDENGQPIPGAVFTLDDFNFTSTSSSNPNLDPMESTQFDVSLEWYYAEDSSAYLALFTKDITGYKVDENFFQSYDIEGFGPVDFQVTRPVSTGTADLKGLEISLNHFFSSLPAPFDGLGIQANYTYIDSSTELEPDGQPLDTDGSTYGTQPFKGISKNAYNLIGIYQKGPLTMRLAYNWRSEFLTSIGANGFNGTTPINSDGFVKTTDQGGVDSIWRLPVYNDAAGYLDGSISYQINDNFTLSLEANNLSNTVTKSVMRQNGAGDHDAAYHQSDTRYALSLRGHF